MAMRAVWGVGVAMALAGCAHDRAVSGGETITYTTTRCYGTCPAYTITLGPDGQGIFVGQQFTAVVGERRFRASPDQVRGFAARLAPYRPKGERLIEPGKPGCKLAGTDSPSVDVHWQVAVGAPSHLHFYYGCRDPQNRGMTDALRFAPDALPIAALIGKY
jgi:hypothetical protein